MQQGMKNYSNPVDYFDEQKTFNIKVKNTYTGEMIEETWQTKPKSPFINKIYGPDVIWPRTQVGFVASMTNNSLELRLNEIQTYLNGKSLKDLRVNTYRSSTLNKCLANALDKAFPKVVAGSKTTEPKFDNIALFADGAILEGMTGCKHTYFINDNETISYEGSCPK